MVCFQLVVAVGRDHERMDAVDPACDDSKDVQSRLVGPMQVLQHENCGRIQTELFHEDGGDAVRDRPRPDALVQLPACAFCDIDERPKRTRCEERVTSTDEKSRSSPALLAEALDERRLPNSRLTIDEYDAAASRTRLGECLAELA